jgi:signal transduction histidine kinase/ActR/RegA family two-component response regulator
VLAEAAIACETCTGEEQLFATLARDAGVLVIAEESLDEGLAARLGQFIQQQPPWSDLPVLVVAQSQKTPKISKYARLGNVSILTRPMALDALVSSVRAAIRARERQYQVRDLLETQEEQARRKDQFLAMLAHELRNPLAPIRYASHALQLAKASPEKVEDVARLLDRQVGHMGRIIDQLLQVSRVSRGLVELERRVMDLTQLVTDCVRAQRAAAEAKGLRLLQVSHRQVWVDGDETRLKQVLDNLLHNAIKFTPSGGTIQVELALEGGTAVMRVRDDGEGMDRSTLAALFEPFTQADRSLDRSRGGLGLGLALVRGLVELHGGKVEAASAGRGLGSAFTVRLPAVADAMDAQAQPYAPPAVAGQLRVLVAEDNADTAASLRVILESYGYEVTVVHSGSAAVDAARQLQPDAVLCDIGLPGLTGYEVARRLRAECGDAQPLLIAVTGYGTEEDRSQALNAGFDAHFAKPIAPLELLAQLTARTAHSQTKH